MKNDKEKTDDSRITALEKEMKRMGFLIRKIKSWLEVLHGADIDGDNQIDKANDHGRAQVWILVGICMIAGGVMAANAYLFNLSPSGAAYPFSVGTNKTTYVENLTVSNVLAMGGNLNVSGAITAGTAKVTGLLEAGANLIVSGVSTTKAIVADGVVDADSFTSDAGSGLDCQAAGALPLGAVTASSVDISKSGDMTTVKGTFNVDEAVTLDSTMDVAGVGTFAGTTTRGRVDGTNLWEFINTGTHRGRLSILKDALIGYGGIAGGLIVYTNTTELFKVDIAAKTVTLGAGMTLVAEANAIDPADLDVSTDVQSMLGAGDNDAIRTAISVPADSEVWGSCTVTVGALAGGQLIATNAIVMLDTAGTAKTGEALIEVWISETPYGAVSTNNIEALTLSGGTAVRTILANGDYMYVVGTNGQAVATITATAAGTNYLNVSVGANVTTEEIILIP